MDNAGSPITLPLNREVIRMHNSQTYYGARLGVGHQRAMIDGNITADACIIGAGLAGLATALELARAGLDVVILEAAHVGFGASGRNGGFVGPAWSQRLDNLSQTVGEDHAAKLYRLSLEGVEIVSRNIKQLEIPQLELTRGKLSVARTPSRDAFLRRRDRLRNEFGQNVEVWDTEQVRAVLKTSRYFQALYYPDDFQINPLAYARGLAMTLEQMGGKIFERSRVKRIDRERNHLKLNTESGSVTTSQLVIATGGYTDGLIKGLQRSFIPISTYIMLTEARPELIGKAIATPFGIGDQRRAGDYYRLVDGGTRILWGGRITTRISEPRQLAKILHRTMSDTFPQLEALKVDYAWSGLMGYARHLMPQIRQIEKNVWSCTSFGGHGINTTAIGGTVLAEAILHKSDRLQMFKPFGLDWNGGPFGRAAVQATYWWMQARDKFAERMWFAADTGA